MISGWIWNDITSKILFLLPRLCGNLDWALPKKRNKSVCKKWQYIFISTFFLLNIVIIGSRNCVHQCWFARERVLVFFKNFSEIYLPMSWADFSFNFPYFKIRKNWQLSSSSNSNQLSTWAYKYHYWVSLFDRNG